MKNNSIADFVAASMDAALKSEEYKTLFGTQYKYASECEKCHKMHGDKDSCMADDNAAKKHKDSKESGDSSHADDNDAKKSKDSSSSSSSSSKKDSSSADDNDARGGKKCKECGKPMGLCKCDKSSADDNAGDGKDPSTGATVSGGGSKVEFPMDSIKAKPAHAADSHSANTLDSTTANPYPGKQYDADEYRNGDVLKADDSDDDKVSSAYDVAIDSLLTASAALDHVNLGRGSAISLKLASLVVEAKKKEKDSKKSKDSKKDSKKSDSNSAKDKKHSKDSKDSKKSDSHSAKDKKSDSKKSDSKDSKDSKKSSKK